MNDDDLLIISPLDQDLNLEDDDNILEGIEQMILDSISEHNYMRALNICKQLVQLSKISGLALAKALYLVRSNWEQFGMNDNFYDTVSSMTGLHKATVQRYCSVWSMYAENKIPLQFLEDIKRMNIKSQIPIAKTLDSGYEIEEDDWEDLSRSSDFSSVSAKIRDIRGQEPRASALVLFIDRDGTIKVIKDEQQYYVG